MSSLKIEIEQAELGGYIVHLDGKRMAVWGQGEMTDAVADKINAVFGLDPMRGPVSMPAMLDGSRDAAKIIVMGDNPTVRRAHQPAAPPTAGLVARAMKAVGG